MTASFIAFCLLPLENCTPLLLELAIGLSGIAGFVSVEGKGRCAKCGGSSGRGKNLDWD